ncbi:DgyrCDS2424 [Dimorphilus gyrociliatus]|uniref:DgyrCDS2424 n=1 Tax=Dimorphilus gyrociliatus TaxID=2664684 RepID=A0A7I8VC78_9ANNE|nr:DgyrCDS2424 [Dimorphilus gyrociliatus]
MTDSESSDDEELVQYELQSLSDFGYSKSSANISSEPDEYNSPLVQTLALNQQCQANLVELRRKFEIALSRNRGQQREIEEDLNRGKPEEPEKGIQIFDIIQKPYIQDENGFAYPETNDSKFLKKYRAFDPSVRNRKKWFRDDVEIIEKAVREDTIYRKCQPFRNRLELLNEKLDNDKLPESQKKKYEEEIDKIKAEMAKIPTLSDEELLEPPDQSHEIDWLKISVTDFKGIHSEENCRLMWSMVLHPSLSGGNFSTDSLKKLIGLVEKGTNWNTIAKEMGENRSVFECLRGYLAAVKRWPELDEPKVNRLSLEEFRNIVAEYTNNQFINWYKVSEKLGDITPDSCVRIYKSKLKGYMLGPWTEGEEDLLRLSIETFGADYVKASRIITTRSALSCRQKYEDNLDETLIFGNWTTEEDLTIMQLKEGANVRWVDMAKAFSGRTSKMLFQRYQSLSKWKEDAYIMARMNDSELSLLITASEKFLHEMDLQSFKENLRSMKKSYLVKEAQARIKDFNETTKNTIDRALNAENLAELKKIKNPELNDIVQGLMLLYEDEEAHKIDENMHRIKVEEIRESARELVKNIEMGVSPPKPLVSMQLRKAKIDLEVIRSTENERQLKSLVFKSLSKGVKAKARRLRYIQERSAVNEKKRSQKLQAILMTRMRNFGRITKVKDLISLAQVTEYELKSDAKGTKRRCYHLQKESREFLKQGAIDSPEDFTHEQLDVIIRTLQKRTKVPKSTKDCFRSIESLNVKTHDNIMSELGELFEIDIDRLCDRSEEIMSEHNILEHDLNKLKIKHMNDSLFARTIQHNVQDVISITTRANAQKRLPSADLPLPAQIYIDKEYSDITPLYPTTTTMRGYDRVLRALPLVEYRLPAGSPVTFKWDNVLGSMSLCKSYKPHVIQLAMEIEKRQNEMSSILMHRLNAMAYEYKQTDEYKLLRKRILTTFTWPRLLEQFSVGDILHEIQREKTTSETVEDDKEDIGDGEREQEETVEKVDNLKQKRRSKGTSKSYKSKWVRPKKRKNVDVLKLLGVEQKQMYAYKNAARKRRRKLSKESSFDEEQPLFKKSNTCKKGEASQSEQDISDEDENEDDYENAVSKKKSSLNVNNNIDESYVQKFIKTSEIIDGERMRVAKNSKGDIPVSEWPEQEFHFNMNKTQLRKFKRSGRRKTNYECYVPLAKFFVVGNAFVIQIIKDPNNSAPGDNSMKAELKESDLEDENIFKIETEKIKFKENSFEEGNLHLLKVHDFPAGKMLSVPLSDEITAFVPIEIV